MNSKSYKNLFENIVVFGFGNLGSKLINFLLVPLYTYYLTQEQFGIVDLTTVTISLVLPLVSASMYDAIMRFVIDSKNDQSKLMSNSLFISLLGYFISALFFPIFNYLNFLGNNLSYFYILLFLQMIRQIFAQYTRGIGKSKTFALNGVILTFSSAFLNILFIVTLGKGLDGYFISLIISYLIAIIHFMIISSPLKETSINKIDLESIKTLLKYSIPLIPNSMIFWLINSSSRFIINIYLGIEANGLFGISSRIPQIVTLITTVFFQAWQVSAFTEYDNNKNSDFFSKIFTAYGVSLFLLTGLVNIILIPLVLYAFSDTYFLSWQPVPFLMIGASFSALSGFLAVSYTAAKDTKGALKTVVYGGIISIVLNFALIPNFGIIGAGISQMVSYFALFIIRYFDTKKLISIDIQSKRMLITIMLLLVQSIVLFLDISLKFRIAIALIIYLFIIFSNKIYFVTIFKLIKSISQKDK